MSSPCEYEVKDRRARRARAVPGHRAGLRGRALALAKAAARDERRRDEQPDERGQHVQAVEADEREERRAVDAGGEAETVADQADPLVALDHEEQRAQRGGRA